MKEKHVILYFTGTHNSLMAADMIGEAIEKEGLGECRKLALSQFNTKEMLDVETLGIVCPVYYWGLPNLVRETVAKLRIKKGAYIYGVITMGSSAGNALPELNQLLKGSGNTLSYGAAVKCPDNYSTVMGMQKTEKHESILQDAKEALKVIGTDICQKKLSSIPKCRKVTELLFSSYRRSLAKQDKKFYVEENCNGCGICAKNCPVGNIRMEGGKPEWQHNCEFCVACISYCPKFAIEIKRKTKGKPRYQNPFS